MFNDGDENTVAKLRIQLTVLFSNALAKYRAACCVDFVRLKIKRLSVSMLKNDGGKCGRTIENVTYTILF